MRSSCASMAHDFVRVPLSGTPDELPLQFARTLSGLNGHEFVWV